MRDRAFATASPTSTLGGWTIQRATGNDNPFVRVTTVQESGRVGPTRRPGPLLAERATIDREMEVRQAAEQAPALRWPDEQVPRHPAATLSTTSPSR